MGTATGMIRVGRGLLGVREHPMGSNHAPPVTDEYGLDAAWCDMSITYEANHSDNLDAVGGRFAYVPAHAQWFRSQGRFHAGTSGMQPGDVVFYNWSGRKGTTECDHVGLCERVLGDGTFYVLEGNHDDQFERVHRDATYISGYGRPAYDSTPQEDDVPTYVSVYKTDKSRREVVDANEWQTVYFDHNGSGGAEHHHGDGDYPSIATGPADYTGDVTLVIEGLPEGTPGQARPLYVNAKTNAIESRGQNITEFLGSAGKTYVRVPLTGYVGDGQKLRIEVTHFGAAEVKPTVTGGEVHLQVWERK